MRVAWPLAMPISDRCPAWSAPMVGTSATVSPALRNLATSALRSFTVRTVAIDAAIFVSARGWSLLGLILDSGSRRYDCDQDRKMRPLRTRILAMGEPRVEIAERLSLPDRLELDKALLGDEETLVAALIERARVSEDEQREIAGIAETLVLAARAGRG